MEDLDDQTLVIKEPMLSRLKARLEEVNTPPFTQLAYAELVKELANTQQMPADSSEED